MRVSIPVATQDCSLESFLYIPIYTSDPRRHENLLSQSLLALNPLLHPLNQLRFLTCNVEPLHEEEILELLHSIFAQITRYNNLLQILNTHTIQGLS
jgi:hypothetical protein